MKKLTPCGPMIKKVDFKRGAAYPTFEYGKDLRAESGDTILGFEIAGEDKIFYPAIVENNKGELKVWCVEVNEPKYIRYGWQPYTNANLVNGDGLPASTFRY